jgi:hypothetical protein
MKTIEDLFDIKYGINLELNACEITRDKDGINFVTRTAENNGVVAKVKPVYGKKPQPAGVLTCASGGSVLSTFVQTEPFYSGRDLYILTPKNDMRLEEKLFYCHCIKMNAYRYRYGRQANKTLKDIRLPELPDWLKTITIDYSKIETRIEKKELPLDVSKWGQFLLSDIFTFEHCKCSNAGELINGDDVYYIGAKKNDNGIMKKAAYNSDFVTKGNCIVFICNGQGSVGYTNYMNIDFIGTTSLVVGYNKNLNKYNGLFFVTVLDLERPKYCFGRKQYKYLSETIIKLPIDKNGEPDWIFMENYMKALPYSDKI